MNVYFGKVRRILSTLEEGWGWSLFLLISSPLLPASCTIPCPMEQFLDGSFKIVVGSSSFSVERLRALYL